MSMVRNFHCDSCGFDEVEKEYGDGVCGGWSMIKGIRLNETDNPMFCPNCTIVIMNIIDETVERANSERLKEA